MADVNLVVRAHLRGERELNKAERKLLRIAVAAKTADNNMASLGASSKKFSRIMNQTAQKFERIMTDWDKLVKGFGTLITKVLGAATKFMVAEFAAVAASMIVVHALFKVGRWLMKGYHGAIKMVAAAATGTAAALAVLSAAIREQQAAMFSYKGLERNYKDLKNGISAVRSEMRGMATDVTMAAMGIENLNTIYAGASQRGTFSKSLTKGLMDIAAAGQPLESAAKWLGEVVGLLTDPKANWGEVSKAFQGMGKMGEETWKKLSKRGINTVAKLQSAIRSGLVSEIAGVEGQWDAVSGTLVSRFKAAFTIIRTDFADIGDAFLGDVKGSLEQLTIIFRRLMFRIRGDVIKFGKGGLLGGMVGAMEGIERNMVQLVDKWLPMAAGMFDRISSWWDRFTDGWKKVTSSMAPLLDAARVLEDMFMNILRPVGDYFSDSFKNLRIFLIDSKKDFLEHGDAIGRLLTALLSFQGRWTEMFKEAMPFINKMIDGITLLVDTFTKFSKGVQGVGNWITGKGGAEGRNPGFGSAFSMMALSQMFRGAKNTKGTLVKEGMDLKNLNTMTVTAAQVNINGAPMGGGTVAGSGAKALADYGYAPSAAVIHATKNSTLGIGGAAAAGPGAATAAAAAAAGVAHAQAKQGMPGADPFYDPGGPRMGGNQAWFGNSYSTEMGRNAVGFPFQTPNQQALDFNAPQYDNRMFQGPLAPGQWRDPTTGRMVKPYVKSAIGTLIPRGTQGPAAVNQQGSLFADNAFTSAPGMKYVPRAGESWADRVERRDSFPNKGTGGMAEMLGTGTNVDYTAMSMRDIKSMMASGDEFLPTGPGGQMEENPYHGMGVGQTLQGGMKKDPITGKRMPWRGRGGVKANLKAAWQREKVLQTTRITGQAKKLNFRNRMMGKMGAGTARGTQMKNKLGSGSSFGMRMGAGMGMGVMSGFMGEEAQGAMNLGSQIAMINPLLGAAVGFGGAALKSKTVAGGMMSGAAGGAALGGMIGPGGAVVGAVVGGILGGVMGHFGKGKAAREEVEASARETAAEIWGGMISGIDAARAEGGPMTGARMRRAMNVGQMSNILQSGGAALKMERESQEGPGHAARQAAVRSIYANQDMLGVEMSVEERDKALRRPFEFLDEMLPEITKHHGAAEVILNKYTNRMEHMTDMFSVTEDELLEMATTVGVNLYDATEDTTEMVKKLSGALMLTRDAINNVFQEIMDTAYNAFGTTAGVYGGEIGMDESARAFKEMAASGEIDTSTTEGKKQVLDFLQAQMGFATDLAGGDMLGATGMINRLFGEGKAFTQAGGPLQGLGSLFQDPVIQAELAKMLAATGPAKVAALTQTVTGNLGNVGLQGDISSAGFAGITGPDRDLLNTLFANTRDLDSGTNYKDDEGNLTSMGQGWLQTKLDQILGVGAVSNLKAITEGVKTEALSDDDMAGFAKTFETSVGVFKVSIDNLVAKLGGDTKHPFGDTSSAMAGTLAAHNRISGGLSGKRTITSGYRNYALGSSNSDHVTGRALDLVGDNLGAYQQGIKSGGGYAEFHGMGDSRHLHAVPAMGDTSMSQGGMGSTSSTNNYNISVTGGPNANSREVATLVMNELQNIERSNRERS